MSRQEHARLIVPIAIFLIAVFFRFYALDAVPPGLNSDEATNLLHMQGLMQGQFKISFGIDAREPFLFYLSTVPLALFGPEFFSMRLIAALVGVVTVMSVYGFTRYLFRSILIAGLTSFFAAISIWHIFWSRYGLRAGLSVLFVLLTLWWFWRALTPSPALRGRAGVGVSSPATRGRVGVRVWRDYALAGICAGLALYTYLSARMLPVALVLLTLFAIVLNRERVWTYLKGLALTGAIAFAIFVPLMIYYAANTEDLISHSANLSILDPRVNQGDIPTALWNATSAVAGMYLVQGDDAAYRNIPNRPVFDPLLGAFFVIGIAALLFDLVRRDSTEPVRMRAVFVGIWAIVFVLPSVLSDDPPSFVRTLASMPAVMILPALGIAAVGNLMRGAVLQRIAPVALCVILIAEAGFTFRDYFLEYAPSGTAFYAFDGHIVETGYWVNRNAVTSQIYMAPLWYQWPTMQFIARRTPMKSFESRDTVVLPSRAAGKDTLFVFPQEQENKANKLGERLGALGVREVLPGAFGANYAVAFRVPAQNLPEPGDPLAVLSRGGDFVKPQQTKRAQWDNQLELLGYTVSPEGPGGRNLTVTLFLRALQPMSTDYTFSIKVRDEKNRVWGQEDKWAGTNSYATTQWAVGDLIIEKFYPGLAACAPAGDYRITVEAYDPKTMATLAVRSERRSEAESRQNDTPLRSVSDYELGTFRADPSQGNRLEDLEPEQMLDAAVAPQARLIGWTLTPSDGRAGERFSLSLFWRGTGDGSVVRNAKIRLGDSVLVEKSIALPPEGRGLCTLFDFTLPSTTGALPLFVNDAQISTVNVGR
ncbi:MAG: glycosyltransferase family 39 protein [Chloroflexi bacterium]|nr:glycosyltransferase family 39 protein [Chloroflexota bacterium]